jgi:hypothetical protein
MFGFGWEPRLFIRTHESRYFPEVDTHYTSGGGMLTSRHNAGLQDAIALLNCRRLPGRLNSAETALLLGFQEHDVTVLVGTF